MTVLVVSQRENANSSEAEKQGLVETLLVFAAVVQGGAYMRRHILRFYWCINRTQKRGRRLLGLIPTNGNCQMISVSSTGHLFRNMSNGRNSLNLD